MKSALVLLVAVLLLQLVLCERLTLNGSNKFGKAKQVYHGRRKFLSAFQRKNVQYQPLVDIPEPLMGIIFGYINKGVEKLFISKFPNEIMYQKNTTSFDVTIKREGISVERGLGYDCTKKSEVEKEACEAGNAALATELKATGNTRNSWVSIYLPLSVDAGKKGNFFFTNRIGAKGKLTLAIYGNISMEGGKVKFNFEQKWWWTQKPNIFGIDIDGLVTPILDTVLGGIVEVLESQLNNIVADLFKF